MCEVAPRKKYDNTSYDASGRVVASLTGPSGTNEYVRRLVVSIVARNADAHLKNWSLIYRDGRTRALAPAYDLVSVTVYERFATSHLAFRLGGERDFDKLEVDHFRRFADGVDTGPEAVASVVESSVDALRHTWPTILDEHPVSDFLARYIGDRIDRLPLAHR